MRINLGKSLNRVDMIICMYVANGDTVRYLNMRVELKKYTNEAISHWAGLLVRRNGMYRINETPNGDSKIILWEVIVSNFIVSFVC